MATFGPAVPVLRIFDEHKAREFYVDFLGCSVVFEHRFGPDFPLYMGVSLDQCSIHLTEHHGDACPGSTVRIAVTGIADYFHELRDKNYKYAKPGAPERMPWGSLEVALTDPFGNRLTFYEND